MIKVLLAEESFANSGELEKMTFGLERLGMFTEKIACGESGDFPDLEQFSAFCFSGRAVVCSEKCRETIEKLCRMCKELEIPTVFDPDFSKLYGAGDTEKNIINETAALAGIFLPSIEDAKALCGLESPEEIAKRYLDAGTKKIVVTLDKKGAYYQSAKESGFAPTFRADKVVDTSGAGAAFAVGLISGITEDIPLGEAVVRANACGCIAIQSKDDKRAFPTTEELREYMLSHRFAVEGCKDF